MVKTTQVLALQVVIGVAAFIPLLVGLKGIIIGPSGVSLDPNVLFKTDKYPIEVDSQFRYISGYLVGVGILLLRSLPNIDRDGSDLRRVSILIFIGGLGRLWGLITVGINVDALIATYVELFVPPILCYWQQRIQKKDVLTRRKIN